MPKRFGSALATCLVLVAGLGSCAPSAPPPAAAAISVPNPYPFSALETRVFELGPQGLATVSAGSSAKAQGEAAGISASVSTAAGSASGAIASLAPRVGALAAREVSGAWQSADDPKGKRPSGSAILAVLEGFGTARLELSEDGKGYKLVNREEGGFFGLAVGGAWPAKDGFVIQLFHNPFEEGPAIAGPRLFLLTDSELRGLDTASFASTPVSSKRPDEELFALFPDPRGGRGRWFAQLRSSGTTTVTSRYVSLESLLGTAKELGRAAFEASLAPRPFAQAPASLRQTVEALGVGAALVRARDSDGGDIYYAKGRLTEEAREIFLWSGSWGVLALEPSGRGSFRHGAAKEIGEGSARLDTDAAPELFLIDSPGEGAVFRSIVCLPSSGAFLAAAAWERGAFPETSGAGLVVFPLP